MIIAMGSFVMADILDKKDLEIKKLNEANKRLVEENSNFQIISKGFNWISRSKNNNNHDLIEYLDE